MKRRSTLDELERPLPAGLVPKVRRTSLSPEIEALYRQFVNTVTELKGVRWEWHCEPGRNGEALVLISGEGVGDEATVRDIRRLPNVIMANYSKAALRPTLMVVVSPHPVGNLPVPTSDNPGYTGGTTPGETGGTVGDAREYFFLAAKAFENGLSVAELDEAIENKLAAKVAAREETGRAKAKPRLKWEADRKADEDPATFAWRAYAAEAKAGTLHRGVIYSEDRELHRRLNSWLRSHDMPEGIDIPTLPEWNTRQLSKLAESDAREALRLDAVARRRAKAPAM